MITLHIYCNVPPEEGSFGEFTAKAGELLADKLNKNASFVQVLYTRSSVRFGNQSGVSALIEITTTELQQQQIDSLLEPLSKLLERSLGLIPPTTHIHFLELERSRCVWNGRVLPSRK